LDPVLIISGPTASGKTSLALSLAKKFNGDLISADSRQVYKGLDIVTGKDIPEGFNFYHDQPHACHPERNEMKSRDPSSQKGFLRYGRNDNVPDGYYSNSQIRLYGYDLVTPGEEWNAALFQKYALKIIAEIHSRGRLPIIVGGTGLYLRSLTDQYAFPPPNPKLRHELESLSLIQLQEKLQTLDPVRFSSLNNSDSQNPRRLLRHIEISSCHPERNEMKSRDPSSQKGFLRYGRNDIKPIPHYDVLHLNLNISLERLEPKIRARVIARLAADPRDELKYLKSFHLSDRHPAFTSLGYHHLDRFYQGKITRDQLIDLWTTAERQYAKRQLTWFNKLEHLTRLKTPVDTSEVVRLIKLWYSQGKYGKK